MCQSLRAACLAVGALAFLSGCASNVPRTHYSVAPKAENVLDGADAPEVKVLASSRDIPLLDVDRVRIAEKISRQFQAQTTSNAPRPYRVEVQVTRYEKGNAFARAMLAGLGQIHIDAEVRVFQNPGDTIVNQFTVSETFAWGGEYGASMTIVEVEDPFAEAVGKSLKGVVGTTATAQRAVTSAKGAQEVAGSRSRALSAGALREQALAGVR